MLVTFGVSLAMIGRRVTPRTPATTLRPAAGSVPRSTPWRTFGQAMLSSRAAIPGTPSRRSATWTNSRWSAPAMLTITGAAQPRRKGSWWRRKASKPSLSRPIELRSPAEVSIVRQGTLPARGSGVIVFGTIPPSRCRSTKSTISLAYPNVPDATRIGFGRRRRPSWTDRSIDPPSGGLAAGTFVMGCGRRTGQAGTGRNAGTGRGMGAVECSSHRAPPTGTWGGEKSSG